LVLSNNLKELEKLRVINFDFLACTNIREGTAYLAESVGTLKNVESLHAKASLL